MQEDIDLFFKKDLNKSKKYRIDKIHDKIINCLSLEDLIFLKKYCSKHWYHNLYKILWLDRFLMK